MSRFLSLHSKMLSVGLLETLEDGTIAPDGFQAPEHRLPTVDDSVLQGRWEITFEGDPPPGWPVKRNRAMNPTQLGGYHCYHHC